MPIASDVAETVSTSSAVFRATSRVLGLAISAIAASNPSPTRSKRYPSGIRDAKAAENANSAIAVGGFLLTAFFISSPLRE